MTVIPNIGTQKITVPRLVQRNSLSTTRKKITCLTAYDYPTARLVDQAGVDVVLVQGKSARAAEQLLRDARSLETAGAFAIVLEAIPWRLAEQITKSVQIPTIGIGAGPDCDGQIPVLHDMIGFRTPPKFGRLYGNWRNHLSGR